MDIAESIEDIFSPLRNDLSFADSLNADSYVSTPVLEQNSLQDLLNKQPEDYRSRKSSRRRQESNSLGVAASPGLDLHSAKGVTSSRPITEEEILIPNPESREKGMKKEGRVLASSKSGSQSSPKRGSRHKKEGKAVAEDSARRGPSEEGIHSERGIKSSRSKGSRQERTIAERDSGKPGLREDMRTLGEVEQSLKDQIASVERSVRLAASVEFDSLRSHLWDQRALIIKKFNRILEEFEKTQKMNAYILALSKTQNDRHLKQTSKQT